MIHQLPPRPATGDRPWLMYPTLCVAFLLVTPVHEATAMASDGVSVAFLAWFGAAVVLGLAASGLLLFSVVPGAKYRRFLMGGAVVGAFMAAAAFCQAVAAAMSPPPGVYAVFVLLFVVVGYHFSPLRELVSDARVQTERARCG